MPHSGQPLPGGAPGYSHSADGQPLPGPAESAWYQLVQAPAPADGLPAGPSPILVAVAPRARQRRLTVAFRYLLLVPHLIVLSALGMAAGLVAFIGWFAALFTGFLPSWAHTFLAGTVRWQTRVNGYLFFLTDKYPPFSLEDEDYPVRMLTRPAKLSRLAPAGPA